MLDFYRPSFSPLTLAFCSSVHYIPSPFHLIQMHKCLECLDVSLASMLDTHPLLLFYLCFLCPVAAIRRWSLGVQEQKTLGGAYYDVEIPDDQE